MRIVDGGDERESRTRDNAGRWVFSIVDGGQQLTVTLDFSMLPLYQLRGSIGAAQGTILFYGYKLGDTRIRQRR
jgi:hypothetical protein